MPDRPWEKIAVDLFKLDKWYLIVVDYYSRYFEIFELERMTEVVVINKLKEMFARLGIPEIVRSDNGPQFSTQFKNFAHSYNFTHTTSSPYFAQSNGLVERAVQTAKQLLKKNNDDIYLALLAYRSTPLESGFSPAELIMSRKLRTNLPQLPSNLNKVIDSSSFVRKEQERKDKQKQNYDTRHKAKDLSLLKIGDPVWIIDIRQYGKVTELCEEPRSYVVETRLGKFRRNRWHLIYAPYHHQNSNEIPIIHTEQPTLPCNSNTKYDEITIREHRENEILQSSEGIHDVANECVEKDVISEEVSCYARPKRKVSRPTYLADYVTD
uniref:Integrase catalytic domain-containing protein n=2 Tax=Photinus pyralis TaxID=7054 RepID=A0A1Y1K762_PHOPY